MVDAEEILKYAPEKMRHEAERLAADIFGKPGKEIRFLLIGTKIPSPVECVWLDPSFGMFQVAAHRDKGFMMVSDLPDGTMILNQRIEDADGGR